jgi:predicted aconitase
MPAVAITALLGFCIPATAQALCPELTRLRSEAQAALKQLGAVPAAERCYMYHRLSVAWRTVAQYANDNRESCHLSIPSLNEFERYHREAAKDRDNICAGRPLRPYRADVIQR